ncbi:MAG TPA: aromatic ring-hydroxylating dioxygenase subunit alpha [Xanthobacteraceae bacterium]|nr:aromatic ring-hydroxylating dioxygenase subunit alpha [Xanthobacteraceae bacterium]
MREAENELLTRVGRGTPAGELLRRYWHPVSISGDLTEEKPIKRVTLLGEKLVVFRMPHRAGEKETRYGLVAEQCRHRLASLYYGRVEDDGIRCPYHGWKYDLQGNCLETPPEPPDWAYKNEIRQPAYPVKKLCGLLFAYLGPQPAPLLPRWDCLVREDGKRWVTVESMLDCNWLQPMENSVDPSHLYWLHGATATHGRELGQYNERHEFTRFEYGIYKRRITPGKKPGDPQQIDEHPLIFPTILRHVSVADRGQLNNRFRHNMQIRVPVDDTHTQVYRVNFVPSNTDRTPEDQDPPYEYSPLKDENGEFRMNTVSGQDAMAWVTQGAITDRTQEHLGHGDRGIVMFRRLLQEQIEIVRQGGDPIGVIRDPAKNGIINIDVVNEVIGLRRPPLANADMRAEAS